MRNFSASAARLYQFVAGINLEPLKKASTRVLEDVGVRAEFAWEFFRRLKDRPVRVNNIIRQMNAIGVGSIPIILLVGLFTGAVFALQTGYAFRLFNAETMVGSTVGLSLTREIGPVFTALMVIARMGSAMSAELGSMRVTEQIDALESMAINPFHYLVVPRVLAAIAMLPLLTTLFNVIGFLGAYIVGVGLLDIPAGPFVSKMEYYVDASDLYGGLVKAAIFGFLLTILSCYEGYTAQGGAAGVGKATTRAVVVSSVAVLIVDYFLTQWILEIFGA